MSRANTVKTVLPLILLAATAGCATGSEAKNLTPEEQAYQDAMEKALQPATPEQIAQAERSDPITRASFWSSEYQKDSTNLEVTVGFMRALRGIGSHERLLEVASAAIPVHPDGYELYLEVGRSFMAQNNPEDAARAFARSADFAPDTEAAPLAALGVALDQLERHAQAQEAYQLALERDPQRVSTLSNYGLSLALTGRLDEAEAALRNAVEISNADVRVRQNLALILGLQGEFDEMVAVDPSAPPRSIAANKKVLQDMLAPTRNYDDLRNLDDVLSDLERTPARAQSMPAVPEALVDTESMSEPLAETPSAAAEPQLDGERVALRPTLRGSQD